MRFAISILAASLAFFGCATEKQTFRQSVGRPVAKAGEATANVGSLILVTSGITVVLMPIGIALGVPCYLVGAPLYYGGSCVAGDHPEKYPPEL